MESINNKKHTCIAYFNPDVEVYNKAHQDLLLKFDAGNGYDNFNDFVSEEAIEYANNGDGVTYLVWNIFCGEDGSEVKRELVAYYTLAATSIPYVDRIRLDEEEAKISGKEFDIQTCGISALEIKMFAVNEKYQDTFYEYGGTELPVSAWVMRSIIDDANSMINTVLGFKALFLHALPNAEKFYENNGFHPVEENMQPLHSVDSDYKAMYLALKKVHMNYDD